MLVKTDVFGVNKSTKRSSGPNIDVLGQTKRGGGRAETKNAGVKKFSSVIWTLVAKHKHGGQILKGWVNSEGGG